MKINVFLMSAVLCIFSCQSKSDENNRSEMNYEYVKQFENEILKDSLIRKTIMDGDTVAYEQMFDIYVLSDHENELCYYAMVMAEKFDYTKAYFHLYNILRSDSKKEQKTGRLANYYLLKAYEKGMPHLNSEIEDRFGKDKPIPTSVEYFQKLK